MLSFQFFCFIYHPLKYKHTQARLYLGLREKPRQSMALSFAFPFTSSWATVRSLTLKECTIFGSRAVGWEVSGERTLPRRISAGSLRTVGYRDTGAHARTRTHLCHLSQSSHSLFLFVFILPQTQHARFLRLVLSVSHYTPFSVIVIIDIVAQLLNRSSF